MQLNDHPKEKRRPTPSAGAEAAPLATGRAVLRGLVGWPQGGVRREHRSCFVVDIQGSIYVDIG